MKDYEILIMRNTPSIRIIDNRSSIVFVIKDEELADFLRRTMLNRETYKLDVSRFE